MWHGRSSFPFGEQMKEDHDVSSEDDQMTLGGSYQRRGRLYLGLTDRVTCAA